jgi:hypothetical protein
VHSCNCSGKERDESVRERTQASYVWTWLSGPVIGREEAGYRAMKKQEENGKDHGFQERRDGNQ